MPESICLDWSYTPAVPHVGRGYQGKDSGHEKTVFTMPLHPAAIDGDTGVFRQANKL